MVYTILTIPYTKKFFDSKSGTGVVSAEYNGADLFPAYNVMCCQGLQWNNQRKKYIDSADRTWLSNLRTPFGYFSDNNPRTLS